MNKKSDEAYRYGDAAEFIDDCETGLDIEFEYKGVAYGVLGWFPDGPKAYIQGVNGKDATNEQVFENAEAVLDGYLIDGKPLREIITEVELLLH